MNEAMTLTAPPNKKQNRRRAMFPDGGRWSVASAAPGYRPFLKNRSSKQEGKNIPIPFSYGKSDFEAFLDRLNMGKGRHEIERPIVFRDMIIFQQEPPELHNTIRRHFLEFPSVINALSGDTEGHWQSEPSVGTLVKSSGISAWVVFAPLLEPNVYWSDFTSDNEIHALDQLFRSGHKQAALRLNTLIEDCAEDDEKIRPESIQSFIDFFLRNKPRYPGPGIFCDDNGILSIQWSIPQTIDPDDRKTIRPGLLNLDFISVDQIEYIINVDGTFKEQTVRQNEIVTIIKPLLDRLDC